MPRWQARARVDGASWMPHNGPRISGDPRLRSFVEGTATAAKPHHGGSNSSEGSSVCILWLCGAKIEAQHPGFLGLREPWPQQGISDHLDRPGLIRSDREFRFGFWGFGPPPRSLPAARRGDRFALPPKAPDGLTRRSSTLARPGPSGRAPRRPSSSI